MRELVDAGELSIDSGQVSHLVERGLLVGTDVDGASFNFVAPQIDLDFSQLLSAPKPSDVSYPISADQLTKYSASPATKTLHSPGAEQASKPCNNLHLQ